MIRFIVHVHPGTRTSHVGGSYDGALSVHVRSKAVEGSATNDVLGSLAEAFGVRPNMVHCVRGARSRTKTITIDGDDAVLTERLHALLDRG